MSIVQFRVANGTLALDAYEAWRATSPNTAVTVRTDGQAINPQFDMNWGVRFNWTGLNVCNLTLFDAGTNNAAGPNILSATTAGVVVQGRQGPPPSPPPFWTIEFAGAAGNFSSLPVRLLMPGTGYVGNKTVTPQSGMAVPVVASQADASVWTLVPNAVNGDWAGTTVVQPPEVPVALSVQDIVMTLWNKLDGTDWAQTFTPTLLWWMHEYPTWRTDSTKWVNDIKSTLYTNVFVKYVTNGESGWGSGTPPVARPGVSGIRKPPR
jgi:hypothetical protein